MYVSFLSTNPAMANQQNLSASAWEKPYDSFLSLSPKSRAIAKSNCDERISIVRPNSAVRVVQIFNPVMVKTDVANFQSLVQKLTGKSGCSRFWNKLRKLNCRGAQDQTQTSNKSAAQYSFSIDDFCESTSFHTGSSMPKQFCSSCEHSFSDLDIYTGLLSEGPLPDISMLPPLLGS